MPNAAKIRFALLVMLTVFVGACTTPTQQGPSFLAESCDIGNAANCLKLGALYFTGQGGYSVDKTAAAAAWEKSCDNGDPGGCYSLGSLYRVGDGVAKDPVLGFYLMEIGCDGDIKQACWDLAIGYAKGDGVTKDGNKATNYLLKSCRLGLDQACEFLQKAIPSRTA